MFKRLLNWLRRRFETEPSAVGRWADPQSDPVFTPMLTGVRVDLDQFEPDERGQVCKEMIESNGASLFESTVVHVYTKSFSKTTGTCPRCHAPTRLHCADFISATDVALRAMLAPAGFFCSACPTVIIDDD